MDLKRWLAAGCLVALAACKGECSCGTTDDDDGTTASAGVGGFGGGDSTSNTSSTGSTSSVTGTGTGTSSSTGGGVIGAAQVRVGNFSPGAANQDFCLDGELFAGDRGFGAVSDFIEVELTADPQTLNFGVVDVGGDCAAPSFSGGLEVLDGELLTLTYRGDGDEQTAELYAYPDDIALPEEGNVILRFTQLAVLDGDPAVAIGTVNEDGVFSPLDAGWEEIHYGDTTPAFETEAFESVELVAQIGGETVLTETVSGPSGAIVNAFGAGSLSSGGVEVVIVTDLPAL